MIRLAIVGMGKIARDQHLPALAEASGITLVAVASLEGRTDAVPCFPSLEALLADGPDVDAVALCTPPQGRQSLAAAALRAGKHVLLEKPPGATVAELAPLVDAARAAGLTLFATWHSRFAAAVAPARAFLAERTIRSVRIEWKEDVRVWHPGQDWIWQPGGLGVFDPGINAISILTRIMPRPVFLTSAELLFPANRDAPIAASLALTDRVGTAITAAFDFRQTGPQSWDIHVETDRGVLALQGGGKTLHLDGRALVATPEGEYAGIYRRFTELIGRGEIDVDLVPLTLVADAFMLGRRRVVDAFEDGPVMA